MHQVMDGPARLHTALWRPEATHGQLMRAAMGLETIADSCAGRRRDELLELAQGLRRSVHAGHPGGADGARRHRG